ERGDIEQPLLLAGELLRVQERRELHVLRLPGGLDALEQRGQGEADPRNHHGPRLDAAQRVHTLLEWSDLEDVIDVERLRLEGEAVDPDRPGTRFEGRS